MASFLYSSCDRCAVPRLRIPFPPSHTVHGSVHLKRLAPHSALQEPGAPLIKNKKSKGNGRSKASSFSGSRKSSLVLVRVPKMWMPFFCSLLLLLGGADAKFKIEGNPANDIIDLINANRTAIRLPKLSSSPGLGCMALQYISECMGDCSSNNTVSCRPNETDITEVYAANCGVELPTVDIISGRLVGCQWNYLNPGDAFSVVLASNKKKLALIHSKEHTEVGVGFNNGRHGPFFWCVFFSSGKTNSSFVLEGGTGIKQSNGWFSGDTSGDVRSAAIAQVDAVMILAIAAASCWLLL